VNEAAKIAVVDDDFGIREALEGLINSIGHHALLFASPEALLNYPKRDDVDCLILDVRMPGMTGLELQAALQRQEPRPPIIFMTSYSEEHMRKAAMDGGARCFLGKPVDGEVLIDCIEAVIANRQADFS
jgi:FixJ family two-component response regulator